MSDGPPSLPSTDPPAQWHNLWRDILTDLRDVFDVHFVCATFSYHLARHTGASALVAVADTQAKCYDVWLSESSGRATQMRWLNAEAGLEPLRAQRAARLDKLERPAAEVIGGRIWLLAKRRLLVAPLPAKSASTAPIRPPAGPCSTPSPTPALEEFCARPPA
jgi:hypothetical protein